jgi:hypothetical protein
MFDGERSNLSERPGPDVSLSMKPPFAHLSHSALAAAAAAAISISLSLFFLPGAGVPGQPMPLLPAIGGAAGRVVAHLEAPAQVAPATPAKTASPEQVVAKPSAPARVITPRPVVNKAHRAHRPRARVVRPSAPPPVQVAEQAPVHATPVTTHRFSAAPKAKGKALGHSRAAKPHAAAGAHGNGKALGHSKAHGHSSEHRQGAPPGQAKKASTAPPAAPPKTNGGGPPADHGGGNGHKGDKK